MAIPVVPVAISSLKFVGGLAIFKSLGNVVSRGLLNPAKNFFAKLSGKRLLVASSSIGVAGGLTNQILKSKDTLITLLVGGAIIIYLIKK